MTSEPTDMLTPVTRSELRDDLAQLEHRFDDKLDRLERKLDDKLVRLEHRFDDKLDRLERKFDDKLDLWGGALLARIAESEKRVISELARHTQAVFESVAQQISALDEKYKDLPERMTRLELEVHALKLR